MAVYAAIRDQPDKVECAPAVGATTHGCHHRRIPKEVALADTPIYSGEVLIDYPTGAKVHMTDFGVAHLTGRKPNGVARRDESPVRIPLQEFVKYRCAGEGDRVVVPIPSKAPSVKNYQDQG